MRVDRVGVVGPGFAGSHHIAAWRRLGVPVEVYGADPESAELAAGRLGVRRHGSLAELLAAVDLVDVCVPTDRHAEVVLAAAGAGRHVICEKPLARTREQALEMVSACDAAGVQLHPGHVIRFFPEYALARRTVAEGGIGRPAVLRLARTVAVPTWSSWFKDPARSGGILYDTMIHDVDYVRWVAGEVTRVFAKVVSAGDGGAPTRAYAILTHRDGAISHLEGTWALPGTAFRAAFEIAGERGLLQHDSAATSPLRVDVAEADEKGQGLPPLDLAEDPFQLELDEFRRAVEGGPAARVTAADAMAAMAIAQAAVDSAASGRAVSLEEVVRA